MEKNEKKKTTKKTTAKKTTTKKPATKKTTAKKETRKPETKKVVKAEKKKETKKVEISVDVLKNIIIIALVIVIIFAVSFMASSDSKDYAKQSDSNTTESSNSESSDAEDLTTKIQKEADAISEDEQADISEIKVSKYLKLMDEEEASAIYVARPTCHYCQIQGPIMKNIVYKNPDAPIYYLNTDEFDEDDQKDFMNSDKEFAEGFGTPMVLIIKGGKVVDRTTGLTATDNLNSLLQNNGII